MISTRAQAKMVAETIKPALVLNGDAGGVAMTEDFKPVMYQVQAGEKTFATFELTVTNPGGHSSRPRSDNAIYELAAALGKIQAYQFPVNASPLVRSYFGAMGKLTPGEIGQAMQAFAANPEAPEPRVKLLSDPGISTQMRTTCVATMLRGGHAENALPQSATATVNCRIMPGEGGAAATQAALAKAIGNDNVKFKLMTNVVESPESTLTPEVRAAVMASLDARYPGLPIVPELSSGGTDGMHYRALGMNTVGIGNAAMRSDGALSEARLGRHIPHGRRGLAELFQQLIKRAQAAYERALVRTRAQQPARLKGRPARPSVHGGHQLGIHLTAVG